MTKAATKQVEEFTAEAKKTMEEGVEKMSKGLEDATQFGQENVEALVASSKVVAKAAEEMNAQMMAFSKKSYEDSMAAAKEFTSVKSVSEFFEMQTQFAKSSFEGFVAEATKMNEMYSAAAKDAFEPINARFTAAAEMVKTYRA
ncbi:MAG: phasin family protein [Pseudomonadota bacterium]